MALFVCAGKDEPTMKVKKKLAFEEGTKLQRELQRTEKDIELVVQDTLNPLFLR